MALSVSFFKLSWHLIIFTACLQSRLPGISMLSRGQVIDRHVVLVVCCQSVPVPVGCLAFWANLNVVGSFSGPLPITSLAIQHGNNLFVIFEHIMIIRVSVIYCQVKITRNILLSYGIIKTIVYESNTVKHCQFL